MEPPFIDRATISEYSTELIDLITFQNARSCGPEHGGISA
jgi:hypothetical protein